MKGTRLAFAEAILEASADGILVLDGEGLVLVCNPAAEELLGRPGRQLAGTRFGIPAPAPGSGKGPEIEVVRPDGTIRAVELRTAETTWGGREVVVVTLRDITRRLEMEEALRESRDRMAQFTENAEGVFFLSSVEGELLYVSPGIAALGGRDDVESTAAALELVHPDDRASVASVLGSPDRAPYELEFRIVRPDEEVRWVRLRGFPVRDDEARVYRVAGWVEDVTEERVARERLERTTRLLDRTISSMEEAVLITEPGPERREIRMVNPAAERMFGYRADELEGMSPRELVADPAHWDALHEARGEVLGTDGRFHASDAMRRRDGSVFEAEQTVVLLDSDIGIRGSVVNIVRDVSVQRRAESEMRESEERFRQIAEHIKDVFWIRDVANDRIEYVSPAFRDLWGRSPEALYESSEIWSEAILPSDRRRLEDGLSGQLESGWEAEYRIVRPDGEVRWVWDRAFPVQGADGRTERVIGVAEDVTERKLSEERFGVLSQEIADLVYVVGPDGIIRFGTPSAEGFAGYSLSDLEGLDVFEWVHPEDRERVRAQFEELIHRPGAVGRAQYRIVTRDGDHRHVEAVARNRLDHPAIGGVVITVRDVTERLELEEQLRQSQKMEAIGRLAGGIAHDFNNLLTVIRSQTDLLLMDLAGDSPLTGEIEGIQSAADRAAQLTSQLLAFSRDQVLRPRVVGLSGVVQGMGSLLERIIGEDILTVRRLADDLPPVEVDPAQLEQVVLNLAVNARDAMPRGGTLTLSTTFEEVSEEEAERTPGLTPGPCVVLRVADNGVGMGEDVRARIFEPFFTTKGTGKGTGLGMAMTYGFVKQSGGSIHVDSEPGVGTTFAIRFPVADGRPEALDEESRSPVTAVRAGGRVLLVEDDPDVRRVTTRILERAGLDVRVCEHAEAGLEALHDEGPFEILLTDLVLPGMSGRALVDRVMRERPETEIVVMSGYAEESPGERGDLPDEVAFIQKPFTPDKLVDMVREKMGFRA